MESNQLTGPHDIFFRCVEDCSEPIMITDAKGVLVYVNPAWVQTYGYSKEEAIGQTPRLLRSDFQEEDFYRKMWTQISDPKIGMWRGELVNRAKDGRQVTVLLTIAPYRDPQDKTGPVLGYMGIALDLTSKKEMELKILQQDRLASLGLVASGLAHEVGTPLGVVRGRAEFLMMSADGNEPLKRGLDVIVSQIDRISKLIRSFLRASRSPEDLVVMPVDIEALLQEALLLVQQNTRKNSIEVQSLVPQGLMVAADANHLHQVFLNLLINAIHAIEIQAARNPDSARIITLSAQTVDGMVELEIKDSGAGIKSSNLQKLFRPFFTTKDVGKGTGLGLAISAQIMKEMGGSIVAKSEGEGRGASFTLHLPLIETFKLASQKSEPTA